MKTLYVSGPMTGYADDNRPAFHVASASLRARGFEVISPAELDEAEETPLDWEGYLRRDIRKLVDADTLALLPGWEKSRGARLEILIGTTLGMKAVDAATLEPIEIEVSYEAVRIVEAAL
jgi:hypothetical protein